MKNLIYKILLVFAFSGVFITSMFSQGMMLYKDSCVIVYDRSTIDLRFVLQGNAWNCRYISYIFLNGTNDIAGTEEHDAVRSALDKWSSVANIDFIEACNEEDADIRISWAEGAFGTTQTFDGSGGALAFGFFPPPIPAGNFAGDIFFDDAEDWALHHSGGIFSHEHFDLETVALQEIGHALGLRHSGIDGGVMEGSYPKEERRELHQDDIDGARAIYGNREFPIEGPYIFCNEATYSLDDFDCLRDDFIVTWTASDNITIESGQETGTVTISTTADQEEGFITATIDSGCDNLNFTKNVWIGRPGRPELRVPECFVPGTNIGIMVISTGATTYSWRLPDCPNGIPTTDPDSDCWFNYDENDRSINVYVGQQCSGSISVWASNECGTVSRNFPIQCCDDTGDSEGPIIKFGGGKDGGVLQYMNLYPNPTGSQLSIELFLEYFDEMEEKTVEILSVENNQIYQNSFYSNQIGLDLSGYENGQYFVTVSTSGYILGTSIILIK